MPAKALAHVPGRLSYAPVQLDLMHLEQLTIRIRNRCSHCSDQLYSARCSSQAVLYGDIQCSAHYATALVSRST
jgi:hypothetical protein